MTNKGNKKTKEITNYQQLDNKAKFNIKIAIGQFLAEEAKMLRTEKEL